MVNALVRVGAADAIELLPGQADFEVLDFADLDEPAAARGAYLVDHAGSRIARVPDEHANRVGVEEAIRAEKGQRAALDAWQWPRGKSLRFPSVAFAGDFLSVERALRLGTNGHDDRERTRSRLGLG